MFRHRGHRREAGDPVVVVIGLVDREAAIDRVAEVALVVGIGPVVREVVGPAVAAEEEEEIVLAAVTILVAGEIVLEETVISVAEAIGLEVVETVLGAEAPALEGPEVAALGAEAPAEVGQEVATRAHHGQIGRPRCHIPIDPGRGIAPADLIGLEVEIGRAIPIVQT